MLYTLILLLEDEDWELMPLETSSMQEDTVTAFLRLARDYSCVPNVHLWPLELVLVIWS